MGPKKRSGLGRRKSASRHMQIRRAQETPHEVRTRLALQRTRQASARVQESTDEAQARLALQRTRQASARAQETPEVVQARLALKRTRQASARAQETPDEGKARLALQRTRQVSARDQETPEEGQARLALQRTRQASSRAQETPDEEQARHAWKRTRQASARAQERPNETQVRLAAQQARQAASREIETPVQRQIRQAANQAQMANARESEAHQITLARQLADRNRHAAYRSQPWKNMSKAAFTYDTSLNYADNPKLKIGGMTVICNHCKARKWGNETTGMCCSAGKINLPALNTPPEPLNSLLNGTHQHSKHFLENIRSYNNCFQMTSFGGREIREGNFMPTFKIQGQIYHKAGSLLPAPDQHGNQMPSKILQIYFLGDRQRQKDIRKSFNPKATNDDIILRLQEMLHEHNQYVQGFKTAIEKMTSPEARVVIRADKKPAGAHPRLFNAPVEDEVAVLMVGDASVATRDIVLQKRDSSLVYVADTHRAYDALQYPLIFWHGEDGYHFENRMVNPNTMQPTTKKVSANDFYAYRIMVRTTGSNHLLQYRQLLLQFLVDMFVKIESERLRYLRCNQATLRAESYGLLRDAVAIDGNPENIGKQVILPSSFTGSPRYLHEY